MSVLSEAYVMGLLADLESQGPSLRAELTGAKERAFRVDHELSNLVRKLDTVKSTLAEVENKGELLALAISEKNLRVSTAHQEIALFRRRADDIKNEMDRVGPGAIFARLRRDRARVLVQIEDREAEIKRLRAEIEQARKDLAATETTTIAEKDKNRFIIRELDQLQSQLPEPRLYTRLAELSLGRAHCRLFLDRDVAAWRKEVLVAVDLMEELHRELRAGKYRLDKNSEFVGGRSNASSEVVFAALALGDSALCARLFGSVTDPALFFDEIFNVFRLWCLGLYIGGRGAELSELLHTHQYAQGLKGAYAQCFSGLLQKNAKRVNDGLKIISKLEWQGWQSPSLIRGAGVVCVGALAIARLALDRGLAVTVPGPSVPLDVLTFGQRQAANLR